MVGKRFVFDLWLQLLIEFLLWNFIKCKILCNRPQSLANGNIPELEKVDPNATFPINFVLTYDCKAGYRLQGGDPWRVCRKDGWSGTDPHCEEIVCPDPGVPEHGSREGDNFKVGAEVHFKCHTVYDLLGSAERSCAANGKWTGRLARCNLLFNYCPNPGIPINGIKIGKSYRKGATLKFRCRSGFFQYGTKERTCMEDKTWNGTETKCFGPHDFNNFQEIMDDLTDRSDGDEGITRACKKYISAQNLAESKRRPSQIPYNKTMIRYFAFDVSDKMTEENFKKGIEFAKAMVKALGVVYDDVRMGALVFNTEAINSFFPMEVKTTEEVLHQLDLIEYLGGGTSSATAALQMAIEFINLNALNKDNEKAFLYLITDGNMGDIPVNEIWTLKGAINVKIFGIGITSDVRAYTVYHIPSPFYRYATERSNVSILNNYERLNWLIQDLTYGKIDYSQCGLGMESKVSSNEGKMSGGERGPEHWPWMATLFFKDIREKAAKPELKCGGSIINEKFILTSAHCFFEREIRTSEYRRKSSEEIIVKLGLVDLRNETLLQEFEVETIYIHDDYFLDGFYDNDIALVKLKRPIMYSPYVRPVCLPPAVLPEDNNYPLYKPNEFGWVIGFGHEGQVKPADRNVRFELSKQLKELRFPIQSNATCISSLGRQKESFTERMFCAGDGMSVKDTCVGDGGGPFMQPQMDSDGNLYWTQVGIVSWGIGCGIEGQYGFYTKVQLFRPWIDEKMKMKDIFTLEG